MNSLKQSTIDRYPQLRTSHRQSLDIRQRPPLPQQQRIQHRFRKTKIQRMLLLLLLLLLQETEHDRELGLAHQVVDLHVTQAHLQGPMPLDQPSLPPSLACPRRRGAKIPALQLRDPDKQQRRQNKPPFLLVMLHSPPALAAAAAAATAAAAAGRRRSLHQCLVLQQLHL
jgi:hypothetical protein